MAETYQKPTGYIKRVVDEQAERYLKVFGSVKIAGAKRCGKTWTALEHGQSVPYVDENLDLAKADPSMMLLGDHPHVIDERQRVPQIWDVVRHEVDRSATARGSFIITGSSTPALHKGESGPSHSGAGRMGRVRMHPMTLMESGESSAKVSLADLFKGTFHLANARRAPLSLLKPPAEADVQMPSRWILYLPKS